ncbi:MAG TPA: S8 family serine peptidase [Herpetosiphonaceae bacterium]|nr:S8 family serine peptidase [Herpetosiphonaceae bacterium]
MSRRLLSLFLLALILVPAAAGAQTGQAGPPDDPRLGDQWAVNMIGLECAWATTTGSPDVTVAVIDSGVDMNHPDLQQTLRTDGYNSVDENNDPTDLNGHGTHVSGIIAATIGNGEGVAGVAGGGTRILPIRVMSADGSGTNRDIIQGIQYAVDKDVQIINMSLGSLLPLDSEDIVEAIKDAHDAGVLVVLAAGNSFLPLPNFAFGIDRYALVVAATDPDDRKTDFSNSGPWVAVSAPGQAILSTMPTYDVFLTSELPPEERFNQNYDAMSGTSQATPIVSGVAALLFARHPDWTADQVKAEIQRTATDISEQNPTKRFGVFTYFDTKWLGAGRIDACAAVGDPADAAAAAGGGWPLIWIAGGVGALLLLGGLGLVLRRRKPAALAGPGQAYPGYGPPNYPPPASQAPQGQSFRPTPPLAPAAPLPAAGAPPAWGKLNVERGPAQGQFFLLREPSTVIGREAGTAITIASDNSISRRHVIIRRAGGGAEIEDAGSSHGTRLNGAPVRGATPLRSGDLIEIGQSALRFEA